MRIRVLSKAPLPPVRAWFPITNDSANASAFPIDTIADLKEALSPLLHDSSPASFLLMIDGFELLDSSAIDVVKDGDLVTIHASSSPSFSPTRGTPALADRNRSVSRLSITNCTFCAVTSVESVGADQEYPNLSTCFVPHSSRLVIGCSPPAHTLPWHHFSKVPPPILHDPELHHPRPIRALARAETADSAEVASLLLAGSRKRKRASSPHIVLPSSSSEEESSSEDSSSSITSTSSGDDSTSSQSSSSESSSSDSSSSDSDSDSDSSSSPSIHTSKRSPRTRPHTLPPPIPIPIPPSNFLPSVPVALESALGLVSHPQTRTQPPVPPGQGKPSTRARNARRKVLRAVKRSEQPAPASSSKDSLSLHPDVGPLFPDRDVSTPTPSPSTPVVPASYSLKNKNKRRGFKESMASIVPTKIDFRTLAAADGDVGVGAGDMDVDAGLGANEAIVVDRDDGDEGPVIGMTMLEDDDDLAMVPEEVDPIGIPPSTQVQELSGPGPTQKTKHTHKSRGSNTAELVPPSRMMNLPRNVIVSSVDVEADLWGSGGGSGEDGGSGEQGRTRAENRNGGGGSKSAGRAYRGREQDAEEPIVLNYSSEPEPAPPPTAANPVAKAVVVSSHDVQWDTLDVRWDTFLPISRVEELELGMVVGWQELGIDYITFSPALLVHLAQIIALEPASPSSNTDTSVQLKMILRPAVEDMIEGNEEDEGAIEPEERTVLLRAGEAMPSWRVYRI